VITYRATLDVPQETVWKLAGWLAPHRHHLGTRKGRRAATCYRQAVMVVRWFRDDTRMRMLAIETDRVAAKTVEGNDLWYSGKHKKQGGNVQVLCDPRGFPVWTLPVEPGSTHDITAACGAGQVLHGRVVDQDVDTRDARLRVRRRVPDEVRGPGRDRAGGRPHECPGVRRRLVVAGGDRRRNGLVALRSRVDGHQGDPARTAASGRRAGRERGRILG
jgi:DDE superfamily endonuclease